MANPVLASPTRFKIFVKGTKWYLPAVAYRGKGRTLHQLCRTATQAQDYAERFMRRWRKFHA